MTLSRAATEAAYRKHRELHEAREWAAIAELFAPDGSYAEPFFGQIHGRDEIRAFLIKSMTGLEAWTFPLQWIAIDEGRVVTHWLNRLPGERRGGGYFEFPGISTMSYDDEGRIVHQLDFYDRLQALQVIAEARSTVVERTLSGIKQLGHPLVMGIHRLVASTAERRG